MNFNFQSNKLAPQKHIPNQLPPKTKLTKKYTLHGFQLTDVVWMRPAQGRHKYEIMVRYVDPESPQTKREGGVYQKIIKFGQKGVVDYTDAPHLQSSRERVLARLKTNCDNPLHVNFYVKNILNGQHHDVFDNFRVLKKNLFS